MANLFDSANYPEGVPAVLVAGDRWLWKRTDLGVDYPPADYALTYSFRSHTSTGVEIEATASESGRDYLVEVDSATTAGYSGDVDYSWDAWITRSSDSERIRVDAGTVSVLVNKATNNADPRSHVKIVLDALQATLEGRASTDQLSYSISTGTGSRSLSRMSPDELLRWEGHYRHRYALEVAKENAARGLATGRKISMRFA